MSKDSLVTRLEVDSRGFLYAGFRGLGGIHYRKWLHPFTSDILGRHREHDCHPVWTNAYANFVKVQDAVRDNPAFTPYQDGKHSKYWWFYWIECPVALKEQLPTVIIDRDGKDRECGFVPGHYTQVARWKLCHPGRLATLDDTTLKALSMKKKVEAMLDEVRAEAGSTRAMNDLDVLFRQYDGQNMEQILALAKDKSHLRQLDPRVFDHRREIAQLIKSSYSDLDQRFAVIYAPRKEGDREHELMVVGKDWEFLKHAHMGSAEYYLNLMWMFLDTENPLFKEDNNTITWSSAKFVVPGQDISQIHTVYNSGRENIAGYQMFSYPDEDSEVRGLRDEINRLDPAIVLIQNAPFDLTNLRDTEPGFGIGQDSTNPIYKSTAKLFERMGIKDRLVFDSMRWHRMARPYDVNSKLEMIAGIEKSINYAQMAVNEHKAILGDKDAMIETATYLTGDVDALAKIKDDPLFKKTFEDAVWLCERYNLGIDRVLHTLNSVNDVQERLFWENIGTFRDQIPPHIRYKNSQQKEMEARALFMSEVVDGSIRQNPAKGFFRDVYKTMIPVGDILRDALAIRFPDVKDFFEYKDQHKADKQRMISLENVAYAFSRWMITDYGYFLKTVKSLYSLLGEHGVEIHDDPYKDTFEEDYHILRRALDHDALDNLNKARLPACAAKRCLDELKLELLEDHGLSMGDFVDLANIRSAVKRRGRGFVGTHQVFSDRRYFRPEKHKKSHVMVLEDILDEGFAGINKFIDGNNLEFIGQEGRFVYLRGNKDALLSVDAPLVLADEISMLYAADKIYYKKNGYISHMKLSEEPTHTSCVFEMEVYENMMDALLDGNREEAVNAYRKGMTAIMCDKIPLEKLLLHVKSKNLYRAFAQEGELWFTEFPPADAEVIKDASGEHYRDGKRKVYVRRTSDIKTDKWAYHARLQQKGNALLSAASQIEMRALDIDAQTIPKKPRAKKKKKEDAAVKDDGQMKLKI